MAIIPLRLDFENEITQCLLLEIDEVFIYLLVLQVIYEQLIQTFLSLVDKLSLCVILLEHA